MDVFIREFLSTMEPYGERHPGVFNESSAEFGVRPEHNVQLQTLITDLSIDAS